MTLPTRRRFLLFTLLPSLSTRGAEGASPAERARIEALLTGLAALPDTVFIRNGSEHDAKSAAKFLRAKWEKQGGEVRTAEEFIDRIATRSGTTGRDYTVRHPDGRTQPCADFLRERLKSVKP